MALRALGTAGHQGGRRRHLISVKHSSPSRRDVRYSLLFLRVEVSLKDALFPFIFIYLLFSVLKNINGGMNYGLRLEFCYR